MQHQELGPYKVCSNDDPELTLNYFIASSTLLPNAFVWENEYKLDFIEIIEVYKLKAGTCSWLSEYMIYSCTRGQNCHLTFVQGHSDLYFQTPSSAKPLGPSNLNFM